MKSSKPGRAISRSLLLITVIFLALSTAAAAQTGEGTEVRLKEFYRWYIHELNANRDPRKNAAKINAITSARVARWVHSSIRKGWDADYFIDGQDWDSKWENGITVSKLVVHGRKASTVVTLRSPDGSQRGFPTHKLNITMVKESNVWKIDRINGY